MGVGHGLLPVNHGRILRGNILKKISRLKRFEMYIAK